MEGLKLEACPICNYKGDIPLELHLLTHSKASLVSTLVQLQHKPTRRKSNRLNEDHPSADTNSNITPLQANAEISSSINHCSQQQHESSEFPYPTVEVIIGSVPSSSSSQTLGQQKFFDDSPNSPTSNNNITTISCRNESNNDKLLSNKESHYQDDCEPEDAMEKTFTVLQPPVIFRNNNNSENNYAYDDISAHDQTNNNNDQSHPPASSSVTVMDVPPMHHRFLEQQHVSTVNDFIISEGSESHNAMNTVERQEEWLLSDDGGEQCLPAREFLPSDVSHSVEQGPHSPGEEEEEEEEVEEEEDDEDDDDLNVVKVPMFRGKVELESEGSNLDVDLMTDEEMPPKGEISEFEESNASLIAEEDSTSLQQGVNEQFQVSIYFEDDDVVQRDDTEGTTTKSDQQAQSSSAVAIIPAPGEGSASTAEKFICFDECQNHKSPKRFSSLFEMIQHKSGANNKKDYKSDFPTALTNGMELDDQVTPGDPLRGVESSRVGDGKADQISVPPSLQCKNYFCIYCDFTSRSKQLLTTHMKADHPDKSLNPDTFECFTCGKIFKTRSSLRKHLVIHRQKSFICGTCNKGFPSRFKLMEHNRVHTGHYPYKCLQCTKCYRTPSLLATHEKQAHPTAATVPMKKVELMCGICHRILHSKRNLESHLQLHKQKPQKCIHCREVFPRQSVLVRHIRASHDPTYASVKTKECSICGKLMHPNSLKSHMLIHKQEKPHQCSVCHKYFRTAGNLSNHAWSHTSLERPFKCRLCPKSYIFLKNLQNHAIVHKRKTLHFVCNECGVKFTSKSNLKRHVEEHSGEKKFKCLICGKKFFRHYYLVEHVRIHSGSRPYTCSICGKASSTKSNHVAHVRIHDARESGSLEG